VLDRPAIDVGGIEEIDAELEGPVHDPEALGLVGDPAEVHRAEAEVADEGAVGAETLVLH